MSMRAVAAPILAPGRAAAMIAPLVRQPLLRRNGLKVEQLALCDRSGRDFPGIRVLSERRVRADDVARRIAP